MRFVSKFSLIDSYFSQEQQQQQQRQTKQKRRKKSWGGSSQIYSYRAGVIKIAGRFDSERDYRSFFDKFIWLRNWQHNLLKTTQISSKSGKVPLMLTKLYFDVSDTQQTSANSQFDRNVASFAS